MSNFADLVNVLIGFILLLIPLLFGLTILFVVWKLIDAWIINAGDEGKVSEGKQIALAAVIGLVVMSGIWGILRALQASLF